MSKQRGLLPNIEEMRILLKFNWILVINKDKALFDKAKESSLTIIH